MCTDVTSALTSSPPSFISDSSDSDSIPISGSGGSSMVVVIETYQSERIELAHTTQP